MSSSTYDKRQSVKSTLSTCSSTFDHTSSNRSSIATTPDTPKSPYSNSRSYFPPPSSIALARAASAKSPPTNNSTSTLITTTTSSSSSSSSNNFQQLIHAHSLSDSVIVSPSSPTSPTSGSSRALSSSPPTSSTPAKKRSTLSPSSSTSTLTSLKSSTSTSSRLSSHFQQNKLIKTVSSLYSSSRKNSIVGANDLNPPALKSLSRSQSPIFMSHFDLDDADDDDDLTVLTVNPVALGKIQSPKVKHTFPVPVMNCLGGSKSSSSLLLNAIEIPEEREEDIASLDSGNADDDDDKTVTISIKKRKSSLSITKSNSINESNSNDNNKQQALLEQPVFHSPNKNNNNTESSSSSLSSPSSSSPLKFHHLIAGKNNASSSIPRPAGKRKTRVSDLISRLSSSTTASRAKSTPSNEDSNTTSNDLSNTTSNHSSNKSPTSPSFFHHLRSDHSTNIPSLSAKSTAHSENTPKPKHSFFRSRNLTTRHSSANLKNNTSSIPTPSTKTDFKRRSSLQVATPSKIPAPSNQPESAPTLRKKPSLSSSKTVNRFLRQRPSLPSPLNSNSPKTKSLKSSPSLSNLMKTSSTIKEVLDNSSSVSPTQSLKEVHNSTINEPSTPEKKSSVTTQLAPSSPSPKKPTSKPTSKPPSRSATPLASLGNRRSSGSSIQGPRYVPKPSLRSVSVPKNFSAPTVSSSTKATGKTETSSRAPTPTSAFRKMHSDSSRPSSPVIFASRPSSRARMARRPPSRTGSVVSSSGSSSNAASSSTETPKTEDTTLNTNSEKPSAESVASVPSTSQSNSAPSINSKKSASSFGTTVNSVASQHNLSYNSNNRVEMLRYKINELEQVLQKEKTDREAVFIRMERFSLLEAALEQERQEKVKLVEKLREYEIALSPACSQRSSFKSVSSPNMSGDNNRSSLTSTHSTSSMASPDLTNSSTRTFSSLSSNNLDCNNNTVSLEIDAKDNLHQSKIPPDAVVLANEQFHKRSVSESDPQTSPASIEFWKKLYRESELQNSKLINQVSLLQRELNYSKQQLISKEHSNKLTEKELVKVQHVVTELKLSKESLKNENMDLINQLEKFKVSISQNKSKQQSLERNLSGKQTKLDMLQTQLTSTQQALKLVTEDNDLKNKLLNQKSRELDEIVTKIRATESRLLESENKSLLAQKQLANYLTEIERLKNERDHLTVKMGHEKWQFEKQLAGLERDLRRQSRLVVALETSLQDLKISLEEKAMENDELNRSIQKVMEHANETIEGAKRNSLYYVVNNNSSSTDVGNMVPVYLPVSPTSNNRQSVNSVSSATLQFLNNPSNGNSMSYISNNTTETIDENDVFHPSRDSVTSFFSINNNNGNNNPNNRRLSTNTMASMQSARSSSSYYGLDSNVSSYSSASSLGLNSNGSAIFNSNSFPKSVETTRNDNETINA